MSTHINGRKLVRAPAGFTHALKTRPFKGMAYEYIVNAATKLGRDIKQEEIVHHRDCDKQNNNPDNLLVLDSLRTHRILHAHHCDETLLKLTETGAYTIDNAKLETVTRKCRKCNKHISYGSRSGLCLSCSHAQRHKVEHPNKETLKKLVWAMPTTKVAKQFGVTDKAVDKWCKQLGVDKPPRGYWTKIKYKK